ncbi:hypothetical protein ACJX0J_020032 [Zea mays]
MDKKEENREKAIFSLMFFMFAAKALIFLVKLDCVEDTLFNLMDPFKGSLEQIQACISKEFVGPFLFITGSTFNTPIIRPNDMLVKPSMKKVTLRELNLITINFWFTVMHLTTYV